MDLDISMRSSDCPYTVHFYGAMFREGDVWICMEVMDISLDKFYARAFGASGGSNSQHEQRERDLPPLKGPDDCKIPENVLGKIAFSVSLERLNYSVPQVHVQIHIKIYINQVLVSTVYRISHIFR